MINRVYLTIVLLAAAAACSSPKNTASSTIANLENDVRNFKQPIDSISDALIDAYIAYYHTYPQDSVSFDYLYKAIEMSYGKMQLEQAVRYVDTLYAFNPQHRRTAEALFLKAFILDNYNKDTAAARICYQKIIAEYPTSVMAKQADLSIPLIGKSADEIVQGFEAK